MFKNTGFPQTLSDHPVEKADQLEPRLLLLSTLLLVDCLSYMFNLTVGAESILDPWKTAYVLPLHKGCHQNELNNDLTNF